MVYSPDVVTVPPVAREEEHEPLGERSGCVLPRSGPRTPGRCPHRYAVVVQMRADGHVLSVAGERHLRRVPYPKWVSSSQSSRMSRLPVSPSRSSRSPAVQMESTTLRCLSIAKCTDGDERTIIGHVHGIAKVVTKWPLRSSAHGYVAPKLLPGHEPFDIRTPHVRSAPGSMFLRLQGPTPGAPATTREPSADMATDVPNLPGTLCHGYR